MLQRILGQERIFEHLRSLISEGRGAGSYLFTGMRGVGKWAYGFLFAAAFCCEDERQKPCGRCRSCQAAQRFAHPDLQILFPFPNLEASKKKVTVFQFSDPVSGTKFSEATGAEVNRFLQEKAEDPFRMVRFEGKPNIPVEVLRDLRKFLRFSPMWGGNRAVLISDIENMAHGSADIFLKTIEEPPSNTAIILTTSYPEKLPATVLSRCRVFTFQSVDEQRIREYLKLYFGGEKLDYRFIERASRFCPGMARALIEENASELRDVLLGMMSAAARGEYYFERSLGKNEPDFNVGGAGLNAVTLMGWIIRDIIVMRRGGNVDDIINCDRAEIMSGLANRLSVERAERFLGEINNIKLACQLSNVMPITAFRHLLTLIKREFAKPSIS